MTNSGKRSRIWLTAAILALGFCLAGCRSKAYEAAPAAANDETAAKTASYSFGVGYSGDGYTESLQLWAERIYRQTDGDLTLSLYGDNILGSGEEMLQAVQNGTLSIVACSTSACASIVPEAAVLDIPACYEDYIRPYTVYDGVFFEQLDQCFREKGLQLLYLRTGEYWLISSAHPITSLTGLAGVRLRTSGSSVHNQLFELLGIVPVENIGLNGIPYILDEKGVDAIETTYSILRSQELLEAQPYALKCPLFVMGSAIVMNADAFQSLPEKEQQCLKQTIRDILTSSQEKMYREDQSGQGEEGLTVYHLTEEEKDSLRQIARPVFETIEAVAPASLLEALQAENQEKAR